MSRDLRFRVASLYFSRPLSRQQYVQAKYAGMAVALFILMGLPITLLLAGALLAELPLGEQLPDYLRAMAGAAIYAVVLAGIGLVVAAMTPRRGLGVAAVVGVLLVLSGLQVAVSGMATEFGNDTFLGYTGLISPYTLVDGVVTGVLGAESSIGQGPPGARAGPPCSWRSRCCWSSAATPPWSPGSGRRCHEHRRAGAGLPLVRQRGRGQRRHDAPRAPG